MPRGYRCIVLAAVGWLIVAAHGAHNAVFPKQDTYAEYHRTADQIAETGNQISRAISNPPDPGDYQKPCRNNEKDRQSELCAQWTAANAAKDSARFTLWGFYAAAAGAVLAVLAVYFTAKATQIARRLVDGIERPYLYVEILNHALRDAQYGPNFWGVQYRFKNIGGAPAFVDLRHDRLSYELTDEKQDTMLGGNNPELIEAGEASNIYTVAGDFPEMEPEGSLMLYVNASYHDTMGHRRNLFYVSAYNTITQTFRWNDHAVTVEAPMDYGRWNRYRNNFRVWRWNVKEFLFGIPKSAVNSNGEGHPSHNQDRAPGWLRWIRAGFKKPPSRW